MYLLGTRGGGQHDLVTGRAVSRFVNAFLRLRLVFAQIRQRDIRIWNKWTLNSSNSSVHQISVPMNPVQRAVSQIFGASLNVHPILQIWTSPDLIGHKRTDNIRTWNVNPSPRELLRQWTLFLRSARRECKQKKREPEKSAIAHGRSLAGLRYTSRSADWQSHGRKKSFSDDDR